MIFLAAIYRADVQWKYFLKAEPLCRGSQSPQSHLVSPFNLKPDCHPPTCISCYYLRIKASRHRERLTVKTQQSQNMQQKKCIFTPKQCFRQQTFSSRFFLETNQHSKTWCVSLCYILSFFVDIGNAVTLLWKRNCNILTK